MLVKLLANILLAVSLVNFFPVDGSLLEWQTGTHGTPVDALSLSAEFTSLPVAADKVQPAPKKIDLDSFGVVTSSQSAIVIDAASGKPLFVKNANQVRSIGSITKIVTALVFLDTQPNLQSLVSVEPEDFVPGGRTYLYYGDKLKLKDVLGTSLVGSDNTATMTLVRLSGMNQEDFVARMNAKVAELGLMNTHFADASGLNADNVSTAAEIAVLLNMVKSTPAIADFMRQSSIEVTQSSGRAVTISATNQLLRSELNAGDYFITAGKTGYIPQAGYCLAVGVQHDNAEVLIVVLGAEDNDARFADASHLASWSFKTFEWSKL